MSNPKVDEHGTKRWYDEQWELHREDGPAVESPDGYKAWYLNDIEYSEQEFNEKMGNVKSTNEKAIRTLIVFNDFEDSPRFLIVDGDFSRFHGVLVNYDSAYLCEYEFSNWMWDQETGKELPQGWSTDSSIVLSKDFDKFALVTFIPAFRSNRSYV
jgi:hypothetical protein